jgi:hypothetical protein
VSRLVVDTPEGSHTEHYGFAGDDAALVVELAVATDESSVAHVLDPSSGEVVDRFPGIHGLLPTTDPDVVIAVFDEDGTIGRYDVAQHASIGPRVDPGFEIDGFWMNGEHLLVRGQLEDGQYRLQGVDLDTGTLVDPVVDLPGGPNPNPLNVVTVDDVMYTIEIESSGFHIERRDARSGEVLGESTPGYRDLASDGHTVVVITVNGQIFEADPVSLEPIGLPFPGTTGAASDLAISDDGRLLMIRGDDETLRFYDVATRTPIGDPIDLDRYFMESEARLRPDGLQAAALTGQGIVVWDLDPELWMQAACDVAGRNLTHAEWDQYIGDLAPYRHTCPSHASA